MVPLIEKRFPNQKLSETMMTQRIMEVCGEVQDFLNTSYDYFFAKQFLNIDNHVFDIKQVFFVCQRLDYSSPRKDMDYEL